MNRKQILSIICVLIIGVSYVLSRFVFFEKINFNEFPDIMVLITSALVCLFILSDKEKLSICICIGNLLGIILGVILSNNLRIWIIWLIAYIVMCVIGIVLERLIK